MFNRLGKKGASLQAKPLKELNKILTLEQFFASDSRRELLLVQLKELNALEAARFDSLGMTLINHLINHCQTLPDSSNSYYCESGGLIDYALNRAEAALTLFNEYVLLNESNEYSEEQKLWQYALLSAALLQGIGKIQIDYGVDLYDANGQFLKHWNAVLEDLGAVGSYFNYIFRQEHDIAFRRRLNIVLATRQLMPQSDFAWIASDAEVLRVWLALLNEDYYSAGTLGAILIRADAIAIQRYLHQADSKKYLNREPRYGRSRAGTFVDVPETVENIEHQIGIEFINWLNKLLANGQVMINQPPLLIVPGGLLMTDEIFKYFVRENPEFKNWQAAKNGFQSLGMHKFGINGELSRMEQNHKMHEGVVFTNYAIALPAAVKLFNPGSGKGVAVSATELVYAGHTNMQQLLIGSNLLKLDGSGQWQNVSKVPLEHKVKPGVVQGG